MAADFFLGESLVGDGNEVAHIDLIIGSKSGPAGQAFCNALANNKDGFTTLLAVVAPNLPAKPDTVLFNKVTIKGAKQAVQMFGPAQAAVSRAVVDSLESGVIPKDKAVQVNATVRKTSAGAADSIPVIRATNLARCLRDLQQRLAIAERPLGGAAAGDGGEVVVAQLERDRARANLELLQILGDLFSQATHHLAQLLHAEHVFGERGLAAATLGA